MDQHAGGKWLIHDTKRRKDNQLQSLKSPAEYPSCVARCDIAQNIIAQNIKQDLGNA